MKKFPQYDRMMRPENMMNRAQQTNDAEKPSPFICPRGCGGFNALGQLVTHMKRAHNVSGYRIE